VRYLTIFTVSNALKALLVKPLSRAMIMMCSTKVDMALLPDLSKNPLTIA